MFPISLFTGTNSAYWILCPWNDRKYKDVLEVLTFDLITKTSGSSIHI